MRLPLPQRWTNLLPSAYLDMATVMGGTFTRNALRGVCMILVAGYLAPQALGVLRAIYSLFKIVSRFADLGLDYAIVTFVSSAIHRGDKEEKHQILMTVLVLRTVVTAAVVLVGVLLARQISVWVLSDAGLTIYVRLLFLAVGGQLLWSYISSYFSAYHDFGKLALFLVCVPVVMLTATIGLILTQRFSLAAGVVIYLFAPTVTAVLWWFALDREFLKYPLWDRLRAAKVLRFARWIWVSNLASTHRGHLNPLLLKNPRLSGSVEAGELNAGLYSFGNDLANEVTLFSQSLVTTLLPKASRKETPAQLRRFVKRTYKHLLLLLVPAALLPFAAKPFILLLAAFKPTYLAYLPSLNVFAVLYGGSLLSIASIPIQTAIYTLNLPQVETYLEIALLFVLVGGGILLIPKYGSMGAALSVLAQRVVSFVVLLLYGWAKLREPEADAA